MTKATFDVIVQPDGSEILIQKIDKINKNHGPDNTEKTNDAKVFSTEGKTYFNNVKIVINACRSDRKNYK